MVRRVGSAGVGAVPSTDLVRDEPAGEPNDVHGQQAQSVVNPGAAIRGLVLARDDLAQGLHRRLGVRRVAALGPREAKGGAPPPLVVAGNEGRLLRGVVLALGAASSAGVEGVVVEGLADEDEVGDAEVAGQCNGRGS